MKRYMFYKGIQGFIGAFITFLILKLPFSMMYQETFISSNTLLKPETPILIILLTFLILPLLSKKIKTKIKLFVSIS